MFRPLGTLTLIDTNLKEFVEIKLPGHLERGVTVRIDSPFVVRLKTLILTRCLRGGLGEIDSMV